MTDMTDELIAFLTARLAELEQEVSADPIETSERRYILDDVSAKRRIVNEVIPEVNGMDDQIESEWGHGTVGPHNESALLLKLLALPFSWHPDYRDGEWKP